MCVLHHWDRCLGKALGDNDAMSVATVPGQNEGSDACSALAGQNALEADVMHGAPRRKGSQKRVRLQRALLAKVKCVQIWRWICVSQASAASAAHAG